MSQQAGGDSFANQFQTVITTQAAPAAPAVTPVAAGATTVAFGQKVDSLYVPRFKGQKGYTKRFAILDASRVYVAQTHFFDFKSVKSAHCWSGDCCKADNPRQSYLVPGLSYDTNKDGDVCGSKISIEYMRCSTAMWDLLCMIHKSQPVDTIDLYIACEDDQYQKLKIVPAGPAFWRKPEFAQTWAPAVMVEYKGKVERVLRSEARYLAALPTSNDPAELERYRNECNAEFRRLSGEEKGEAAAPGHAKDTAPAFDMSQFLGMKQ
jgi:hypothetical protein